MAKTEHIFDLLNDGSVIKLEEMRRSGWGLFFSILGLMAFIRSCKGGGRSEARSRV